MVENSPDFGNLVFPASRYLKEHALAKSKQEQEAMRPAEFGASVFKRTLDATGSVERPDESSMRDGLYKTATLEPA